jgi:hypothetical protein
MHSITIHLAPETERRLKERANQAGQTVEALLGQIAEEAAREVNGANAVSLTVDDKGPDERPWRGVFVPGRPREALFTKELLVPTDELPKREPSVNLNWHRPVTDDE